MKYALRLGRPFGIKIAIHWTFLLLILWVVAVNINQGADTGQALLSVAFVLVLFICVVLHELGHSLAARRYGIETKSITLLPIGGMANIEGMPEKPKQEIVVTASGLAVNVAIALILLGIISTVQGYSFDMDFEKITSKNFLILLMYTNLFIVAFNLIPAFPMDGGRILRAALSLRFNRVKATKYSMVAGQVFGVIFAITGLFVNPFLFVIGIFVFLGAGYEYTQVRFRSMLTDYTAKDIVMEDYMVLAASDPVKKAVEIMLKTRQTGFLVKEDDNVTGILDKDNIIKGLSEHGEEVEVGEIMTEDFQRVEAKTPLRDIFQTIQKKKAGFFPVFENDKLLGIIDQENIQEFIMVQSALREE